MFGYVWILIRFSVRAGFGFGFFGFFKNGLIQIFRQDPIGLGTLFFGSVRVLILCPALSLMVLYFTLFVLFFISLVFHFFFSFLQILKNLTVFLQIWRNIVQFFIFLKINSFIDKLILNLKLLILSNCMLIKKNMKWLISKNFMFDLEEFKIK